MIGRGDRRPHLPPRRRGSGLDRARDRRAAAGRRRAGQIAVLARSLKEIGPRLAYTLRTHGISFHAPLAPHLPEQTRSSLLELAAYPWERRTTTPPCGARLPLFAADPLELRRYRRAQRTLYGALRATGGFEPFFEALAIVKRQRSAGASIYAPLGAARALPGARIAGATRRRSRSSPRVTALSDAANDFEDTPAEFARSFRRGSSSSRTGSPRRRRMPSRS